MNIPVKVVVVTPLVVPSSEVLAVLITKLSNIAGNSLTTGSPRVQPNTSEHYNDEALQLKLQAETNIEVENPVKATVITQQKDIQENFVVEVEILTEVPTVPVVHGDIPSSSYTEAGRSNGAVYRDYRLKLRIEQQDRFIESGGARSLLEDLVEDVDAFSPRKKGEEQSCLEACRGHLRLTCRDTRRLQSTVNAGRIEAVHLIHLVTAVLQAFSSRKNSQGTIMPRSMSRSPSSYRRRYSPSPVNRRRRRDRSRSPYTSTHSRRRSHSGSPRRRRSRSPVSRHKKSRSPTPRRHRRRRSRTSSLSPVESPSPSTTSAERRNALAKSRKEAEEKKRLEQETQLKILEEETARRIEEAIRAKVEEKLESEEVKLEIERRVEEGQKKLFADVEAQLEREKQAALTEARQKEEKARREREELDKMLEENRRRVEEAQRREALELQRKEEERHRELELIQRQKEEAARRKKLEDEQELIKLSTKLKPR
ncbi:hypothetical protein QVD17_35258 [Tagetes erecta]|uniref:Uncharacterized protein n=1 Tax=Tagetes erecta TaxID=13708 RepID=A0AAD8JZ09_TARER|nr:hypothetical protein QVD17_35258 [Tagetes erecta]